MLANRPAVSLTVARIDATGLRLNPLETVYLNRVLSHHGQPNRDLLVKACLVCGSIAESPDQASRDHTVRHFDVACCDPAQTVAFRTENV